MGQCFDDDQLCDLLVMPFFAKNTRTCGSKRKSVDQKWDSLFKFGLTILFLGASPDRVRKGERNFLRFWLIPFITLIYSGFGLFEVVFPFTYVFDFKDAIKNMYLGMFFIASGFQWAYLQIYFDEIYEYRTKIECFISTQTIPDVAETIAKGNLNVLINFLYIFVTFWGASIGLFEIDTIVEFIVILTGESDSPTIDSDSFKSSQFWQLSMDLMYAVGILLTMVVGLSFNIISVSLTLEVVTQCEIIRTALALDTGKKVMLRDYILDHIRVIKNAKWLIKRLEALNTATTLVSYLLFALNMFILTTIEPELFTYIVMAIDFFGCFIQLAAQGWFSTSIKMALESLSDGSYATIWYERDRSNALDVLIVSQMAQQSCVQKVLFGTLRIERATALNILRSSYSFYTLLIVLQS